MIHAPNKLELDRMPGHVGKSVAVPVVEKHGLPELQHTR